MMPRSGTTRSLGNGRSHKGWAWEAGIQIQSSGGAQLIDIAYNVVENNANGITLIDSGGRERRGSETEWKSRGA